jgi:hypothetical protein
MRSPITTSSCFLRLGLLALCAAVTCGCGGHLDDRPETFLVSGNVTYEGEPCADATISFHPQGEQRSAYGRTDSSGNYLLTTVREHDGAMAGEYRVSVSKVINENAEVASTDIAAPQKPPQYKSLLPEKYGNPETSDLTASVEEGKNQFDFTLSD